MKPLLLLLLTLIICHSKANSQTLIKMEDITKHIGDTIKVCIKIYGARYLSRMPEAPTYLDGGNIYPNNPLIIMIAKKDRVNFEDRPEMMYVYKNVCITGKPELENGKVKIIVSGPAQIVIQPD